MPVSEPLSAEQDQVIFNHLPKRQQKLNELIKQAVPEDVDRESFDKTVLTT